MAITPPVHRNNCHRRRHCWRKRVCDSQLFADQPALAETIARFRGEAVALVVGEADRGHSLDLGDFPIVWTLSPAGDEQ